MLLSDDANVIIQKYEEQLIESGYLFPILNRNIHKLDTQKYNRRKKVLLKVNNALKEIAKTIGVKANLTTYTARHNKKRLPVSNQLVREYSLLNK